MAKGRWEAHARDNVEQQPGIQQILIYVLHKYSRITYDVLAKYIRNSCSSSTILRWVMPIEGSTIYSEHIIPLLSPIHRKQIDFFKEIVKQFM